MTDITKYVDEVNGWLSKEPELTKQMFLACKEHELYAFHHSLGRKIRNNLQLWNHSWEPELINGVDYSENHPDSISMRVIREVWKKNQPT